MNPKHLICFFLFLISLFPAYAETKPADLEKKIENTIGSGQASQKEAEAWAARRDAYLNEIRELESQKKWLQHQQEKYQTYISKQKETLAELENRKKEAREIKISLEPFLDELFTQLKTFVDQDMPFLPEERQKRLEFLKDSLDDYQLGLAEKTRRILNALRVEAEYGGTVEKIDTVIELENGPMQVSLFRLGRVALFYLSPDGNQVGWFHPEKKQWQSLPEKYTRVITHALEVAEKKRTPELLSLPLRSEK